MPLPEPEECLRLLQLPRADRRVALLGAGHLVQRQGAIRGHLGSQQEAPWKEVYDKRILRYCEKLPIVMVCKLTIDLKLKYWVPIQLAKNRLKNCLKNHLKDHLRFPILGKHQKWVV